MNKLLPNPFNLVPILDSRQTFSDNVLSKEFYKLNEEDMLKILCDLVKQTMLYNEYPNPTYDVESMIGDDYTASNALKKYIDELNVFEDVKIMLVTNRTEIDIKNYISLHFIVYVKGKFGKEYIVDPTPDVGYGCGEVNDLSKKSLYSMYFEIDKSIEQILNLIRFDMNQISNNIYIDEQIIHFNEIKKIFDKSYFDGLLYKYYNCIVSSNHIKLKNLVIQTFAEKIIHINSINVDNEYKKIETLYNWKNQLNYLKENTSDLKKQQKLAQYIVGELNNNVSLMIDGQKILLNHITPRLLWEKNYNVVIIKPSSYIVGINSSVEELIISKRNKEITTYICNLGSENAIGLNPMAYFHPHGMMYEQQMLGPSKIILVNENTTILNKRKHIVRDTFAQKINGHYVNWFNNEKVKWDTQLNTNLAHTTADALEASIHLLAAYPEYQSFTRFDYPNPILRKVKKK